MTYKPLSELANDPDACQKIWHYIVNPFGETSDCNILTDSVSVGCLLLQHIDKRKYFERNVWIDFDGHVSHEYATTRKYNNLNEEPIDDMFALVDFIRSLGYNAQP